MKDRIISVGIDIGTSTTQLIFSSLTIENLASDYAVPKLSIIDKKVIYESPVYFTPLKSSTQIDGQAVKDIVEKEYKKAGISFDQVKTGAVIITGDTARKENAAAVLDTLSGYAGEFVVSTAGPDLESVLSGWGSGAGKISSEKKLTALNIDIGGGTSNLSLFSNGKLKGTSCLDIGGRLIKVNKDTGIITYVFPKIKALSANLGINLHEGKKADIRELKIVTDAMSDILASEIKNEKKELFYYTNEGSPLCMDASSIDAVTFSGGVGSLIYKKERDFDPFVYGDTGPLLAQSVIDNDYFSKICVIEGSETIRATVIGAGMYTTEISGSTILYSQEVLPVKNIPVLKIEDDKSFLSEEKLKENLTVYCGEDFGRTLAVSFDGEVENSFEGIQKKAQLIYRGASLLIEHGLPLIIVIKNDIAKALGFALRKLLPSGYPLICIDGITASDGDYIDIGRPVAQGQVLPVIIKTLVFNS